MVGARRRAAAAGDAIGGLKYDLAVLSSDPPNTNATLGLVAATVAALFWAIAVVLFRRIGAVTPPVRLNFTKGLIASAVIGFAVLIDWRVLGHTQWSMSPTLLLLMALGGMIGIGLGDTLFFASLNRMGARRALLLFTVNPVITVILAWVLLAEPLSVWQTIGVVLTCSGVTWVIAERTDKARRTDGHVDTLGVCFALGAALCQATGLLISRHVFAQGEITAGASAWLRIVTGTLVLSLFLPLDRHLANPGGKAHHHPTAPSKTQAMLMLGVALLLGTVMGIWLMQVAVKHAGSVGVASTLLSTSPLFVLPIVALMGERISLRAALGAIISIAGVAMLYGV